jgi:hypothetical protein
VCVWAVRPACFTPAPLAAADPQASRLRDELDRLGASFRKAGAADYISLSDFGDTVHLVGPPREHPRRVWKGPEWQALELLAPLPDGAGAAAVWRALTSVNR